VGIGINQIARKVGEEIDKFVQLVCEARKDDNRNALLYNSAGEDSVPLDDERLVLVKVDGTGKYVAVAVLTQSQGAKPGEKIFFARDPDGAIVSKISMLNEGTVSIEADDDISQVTKKNHITEADEGIKQTAKKDHEIEAENITQTAKKDYTADADNVNIKAKTKATVKGGDVELNGKVKATGVSFECGGVVTPTGQGCLCAIPYCVVTGAPQAGSKSMGT